MSQYIYAEPDEVTRYKDAYGGVHLTRDGAIKATIEGDLETTIYNVFAGDVETEDMVQFLKRNRGLIEAFLENL